MDIEDRYSAIEAAISDIEAAMNELKGVDMDDAILTLKDVKWDLEQEYKALDEQLAAKEAAELAYMNREYERSV